ncbi:MAG: D-alanyl-D-alanine carboxypeptidase family protein [Eubacteriales bacterium]|nr:D-alanyl-D-alanine carboxypeptidase family protein [Eubacteriales bacterium]
MIKNKFIRSLFCSVLGATLFLTSGTGVFAEREYYPGYYDEYGYYDDSKKEFIFYDEYSKNAAIAAGVVTPTPTPDPHLASYYEGAQSDNIKDWPAAPAIEGAAAIVLDVNTQAVLYSKNADTAMYPASITKVMTAYLAAEKLNMSDTLTMSQAAAYGIEPGSSSIYADTGEVFTNEQAMMGLMLESANELALALAEETSGSVKKFVELMNERARELGCTNTHFNNPNGLHEDNHYTCASDMAKIARAAWANKTFRKVVTTGYYEIPPTNVQTETRYLGNHHKMMEGKERAYAGVLGGKTGYTTMSGNTLVTYAYNGKIGVVVVVLNSIDGAYTDTASLLDYVFGNFQRVSLNYDLDANASEEFHADRQYYATLPINAPIKELEKRSHVETLTDGKKAQIDEYYFNDQLVGSATLNS